ncbi:SAND domain protein [Oesophagostomum dentatum]|uniref:SAND domain protein n=1 Tax=Oesophagostomum dentatum TaxID=61180 RepID=A0A0B1TRU5_OESDE|nr:SAND domain protein [Oesophagostomum dentatum]
MSEEMKPHPLVIAGNETVTEEKSATNNFGKIIQVRCGSIVANMHVELFLCPGIHQPCIEFEAGRFLLEFSGEMISPKEFTVRANKDKQKDWKGSIRIGKSNLRSLMEMHSFDFFNHTQFCSAKCQSRNYITPKEKDSDKERRNSLQAEKAAAQISQLINSQILNSNNCKLGLCPQLIRVPHLSRTLSNNNENSTDNKYTLFNYAENFSSTAPLNNLNTNSQDASEELVDVDDSLTSTRTANIPTTEQILLLMLTEPVSFWNEMHRYGLLDELVDQLTQCLSDIKKAAKSGGLTWAAPVLTRVVSVLNMSDRIASCIHAKPCEKLPSRTTAVPRVSTDCSSVEDNVQKRMMDESLQIFLPQFPLIKRPRFLNPSGGVPHAEGMDPQVLRALANSQVHMAQDNQGVVVPTAISCARTDEPLFTSKFA